MNNFTNKLRQINKPVIFIIIGIFLLWIISDITPKKQNSLSSKNSSTDMMMPTSIEPDYQNNLVGERMMTSEKGGFGVANDTNEIQISESALIEKKEIRNGNLSLKVEKIDEATDKIEVIAKNQNGEVFSTNFHEAIKGQKSGYIIIKVPIEKFEITIDQIKSVATQITSESTTGQNVTEQYSDLKIRLKNKEAEEQSFIKILDQAVKVEDVLAVTRELSRVRSEIEQLQGQINFMDSQTDLATITVDLSEDIEIAPIQNDWRPWQVVKKSFSDLISNTQDFVDGIIRFIIIGIPSLIPFLILIGIIYWIGKSVWSKIKN